MDSNLGASPTLLWGGIGTMGGGACRFHNEDTQEPSELSRRKCRKIWKTHWSCKIVKQELHFFFLVNKACQSPCFSLVINLALCCINMYFGRGGGTTWQLIRLGGILLPSNMLLFLCSTWAQTWESTDLQQGKLSSQPEVSQVSVP